MWSTAKFAGARVDSGDGLFVHIGLERRAATVTDPAQLVNRAGSDLTAVDEIQVLGVAALLEDQLAACDLDPFCPNGRVRKQFTQ